MNSMTEPENNIETPETVEASDVVAATEPTQTEETAGVETVEVESTETEVSESETSEAETVEVEVNEPEVVETEPTPDVSVEATLEPTTDETTSVSIGTTSADDPRPRDGMNWFVLRVASNKEDYVKAALDRKVEIEAMQHLVGRIMVPTEKTKTLSKTGKAKITETKLYPGYIFVEMKLEEQRISQDIFFLIKETTGVGDFVGTAGKPTPMSTDEVDKMLFDSQAPDEVTEVRLEFAVGDHVNIKEGPFMGYEGTVDEIFPEKGVVRVLATVFGRQTQIEIEYWMIEKAE